MSYTISALVRDEPGVLATIAQTFKELDVNIKSISSGEMDEPGIQRILLCVDAPHDKRDLLTETVQKMHFSIRIEDMTDKDLVNRELVLVKVGVSRETASQIMQIAEVFRASVIGMGQSSITLEMSGDEGRVEGLIKLLKPFGIKTMSRTGKIAVTRGDD